MLPKTRRIPRSAFSELLKERNFLNSEHFSLRFLLSRGTEARVGVSVSKKISKSAAVRNTIRRRVYGVVSPLLSSLPSGLFLLSAKSGAEKIRGESLSREIKTLFSKINR